MLHCGAGYYFTGDGAHRTEGGYYQITGRMDDVINISGHRLGTAEIEDAMVSSACLFFAWYSHDASVDLRVMMGMCTPESSQGLLSSVLHRLTIPLFQRLLSSGTLMTSKEKVSGSPPPGPYSGGSRPAGCSNRKTRGYSDRALWAILLPSW